MNMKFNSRLLVFLVASLALLLVGFFDVSFGYFSLFFICIASIYFAAKKQQIGLMVHYCAIGIYCSIAPAFQIRDGVDYWGIGVLSDNSFYMAYVLCVVYCLGFEVGYEISGYWRKSLRRFNGITADVNFNSNLKFLIVVGLISFFAIFLIFQRPDFNLESRGNQITDAVRPIEVFLFAYLPKLVLWAVFSVLIVAAFEFKSRVHFVSSILALLIAFFFAGPNTTPRQVLIVGILPFIIYFSLKISIYIFPVALWIAVIVVGPILNYFSRDYIYGVESSIFPYSADFDAMYVVSALYERSDYFVLGYGRYLLSSFSFFLPKEVKFFTDFDPLAAEGGDIFSQTNVSTPPFLTAYLDFSFAGPIIFGCLIGWILGLLESRRRESMAKSDIDFLLPLVTYSAYVPFVRGPILGWGPYFMSGVIAYFILILVFNYFYKRKNENNYF